MVNRNGDDMTSAPITQAQALHAQAQPPAGRVAWRTYLPGAAGVAYLATWIIGLAVWPVNLALNATAAQAAASHAAHPAAAITPYLLVEGLAGLLLGAVLASALRPRLRIRAGRRAVATAAVLGIIAVVTSLIQCVVGLALTSAAHGGDIAASGDLFRWLNQLDGVKMLALALAAIALAAIGGQALALPRWLRVTSVVLAVALAASGYAYLALDNALGWTAFVSGILLLLWVTATGIARTVRQRNAAALGR